MKKVLAIFAIFFILFASLPKPALAAGMFTDWTGCTETTTDSNGNASEVATLRCLPIVFKNVINAFLIFVGVVALFLIIYSGIKLVMSGGDPKQVEAARKIMNYAILGAILVLSSFAIIYFIAYITNSKDCITEIEKINDGGCK